MADFTLRYGSDLGNTEGDLFDVETVETANPFGDYAVCKIDDTGGSKWNDYQVGTQIQVEIEEPPVNEGYGFNYGSNYGSPTITDFTGFVVERREVEQNGADQLEVEAYTFDQFLRRNTVSNDQSGNTIADALKDIVETDTPVSWEASNVTVEDEQELTVSLRGEKVETALLRLAFLSGNEDFGVNASLEFYFRQQESGQAERGIDNTQWFNYDIPEIGKETVNEVEVFYANGDRSVIVDNGANKKTLQNNLGLPKPATRKEEISRPFITELEDARAEGERWLQLKNTTLTGEITTFELYRAVPGEVLPITIDPRGIDSNFRIAATQKIWSEDKTNITVVENTEQSNNEVLVRLTEAVKRLETEDADRDGTTNRITSSEVGVDLVNTARVGGSSVTSSTVATNSFLNEIRNGWIGISNPDISTVVVGTGSGEPTREDTSLGNQTESASATETLVDSNTVEYTGGFGFVNEDLTFSDTGESGQNVDVSNVDEVTVELWGPGGGDSAGSPSGGAGGYLEVTIDTSGISTLEAFPGQQGQDEGDGSGGVGLYDGGDGEDLATPSAAGGAASTSLRDGTGTELAHADGGGGAGGVITNQGGGGGARGGSGGDGSITAGDDAEGTGNGGDGGDDNEDGEDGGTEAVDARVTAVESTAGGGNDGDGRVVITGGADTSDTSEIGLLNASGDLLVRSVLDSPVDPSSDTGIRIEVTNNTDVELGVITDTGKTAIRDIIADNSPSTPTDYAYGSDTTDPSESDTSLGDQQISIPLDELLVQSADNNADWSDITDFSASDPVQIDGGELTIYRTNWIVEAEDYDRSNDLTVEIDNDDHSNGENLLYNNQNQGYAEWDFTVDYDIPAGDFEIYYRNAFTDFSGEPDPTVPRILWSIDGTQVGDTNNPQALDWDSVGVSGLNGLDAGTHTLRAEHEGGDHDEARLIDLVAPLDDRFSYNFDNTLNQNQGWLDGPEEKPDLVEVLFSEVSTRRNLDAATAEQTWNDTSNSQKIELSNDGGSTWITTNNNSTATASFSGATNQLQTRVGISRWSESGARSQTPRFGYTAQSVDIHELYANIQAITPNGTGISNVRAIVSPDEITGVTIAEGAELDTNGTTLTSVSFAEFVKEAGQRLVSSENVRIRND